MGKIYVYCSVHDAVVEKDHRTYSEGGNSICGDCREKREAERRKELMGKKEDKDE